MASASASSSSRGSTLEADLAYYKAQYEQLEAELQDFQASSRELEAELEKDIEASEKRERQLQEKAEGLGFEVDEWKVRSHVCAESVRGIRISHRAADGVRVRRSTGSPRPTPTASRTRYRRKSPPYATQTGHYSSGSGTSRLPTMTTSDKRATPRPRWKILSRSTT